MLPSFERGQTGLFSDMVNRQIGQHNKLKVLQDNNPFKKRLHLHVSAIAEGLPQRGPPRNLHPPSERPRQAAKTKAEPARRADPGLNAGKDKAGLINPQRHRRPTLLTGLNQQPDRGVHAAGQHLGRGEDLRTVSLH